MYPISRELKCSLEFTWRTRSLRFCGDTSSSDSLFKTKRVPETRFHGLTHTSALLDESPVDFLTLNTFHRPLDLIIIFQTRPNNHRFTYRLSVPRLVFDKTNEQGFQTKPDNHQFLLLTARF